MWKTIEVALGERVVVFKNGQPLRVLDPGRHTVWGRHLTWHRFDTGELVFDAPAEVRAVVPTGWFEEIELGTRQRGVLFRDGRPAAFLRPGRRRFWTVDPTVELRVFDVDGPVPELTEELIAIIPANALVVATVRQHERGLVYVQGRFVRTLEPGRHAFWTHAEARVTVEVVDTRLQQVTLAGQELMTRDKVTLRLTLVVEFAPADVATAAHAVADPRDAIYLMTQLAARDFVGAVTLDELLEGRDAMTRHLVQVIEPQAGELGLGIRRVGVKDIILPGEMKELMNRVIEAEKKAAANVILRREQAAATRQMANEAKVMADNPVLMRLKELEALEAIAGRVGEVRVLVGANGLEAFTGARLLGRGE
jgi:regulator of protease activity HflC (stomatin/prohibitin superfamily)